LQAYGVQGIIWRWQVPAPSQLPGPLQSVPEQEEPAQVAPTGNGEQVPTRPVSAQETHVPLHAVLQQTPSAQNPDAQSSFAPHGPDGRGSPQAPL
jgi:hypothetical protein